MRLLQEATEDGLQTGIMSDVLLPVALGLIMLGVGMGIRMDTLRTVFAHPKHLLAGLAGQLLLLPLMAMAVVYGAVTWGGLETDLAIGLLLLSALPGGATSNMLTFLARGDTSLSVSLTAITSLASWLTTPAILFGTTALLYGDGRQISVSFVEVLAITAAVVAGPVLIGMFVGHRWPRAYDRIDRPLRIFSIVLLFVLIAGIIVQNREGFWGYVADTIPAAAALNILALAAGFLVAWVTRAGLAREKAIVIEVGFQNGTFGILLATTQLDSSRAALMPGFYSLFMFVTGGLLAFTWSKRTEPAGDAAPA